MKEKYYMIARERKAGLVEYLDSNKEWTYDKSMASKYYTSELDISEGRRFQPLGWN